MKLYIDCKQEKHLIQKENFISTNGHMNNLQMPTSSSQGQKSKGPAPSSSKSRLKKDTFVVYKDLQESPIKVIPVSARNRGVTKEDEEEMDHLINITKEAKDYQPKEVEEEDLQKPMRKVKTNKVQKYEDLHMKPRSPPKVAVRLRIPLCERNYGFRNRESLKNKDIF